ncbi:hypothetical protein ACFLTH_13515 [Bacteroidota bacterium]
MTGTAKKLVSLLADFAALKHNLKGAFKSLKDELDIHLDSINQNTNEIQSNYEHIAALDAKIEKLSDKMDEFQMQLNPNFYSNAFDKISLSKREQEVFMGIYTEEDRISMLDLSRSLGLTLEMCESIINNIRAKGIPIVKQLVDEQLLVCLDYTFKDLQARKNVVGVELIANPRISE